MCTEPGAGTLDDEFVVWNVKAGSRFGATVRCVTTEGVDSVDYDVRIEIQPPNNGAVIRWVNEDLNPGPACLALVSGGYGITARLISGPSGAIVTLHAWIEAPGSGNPQNSEWQNGAANSVKDVNIGLVVTA